VGAHILKLALPSAGEVALFGLLPLIHAYWMGKLGGVALSAIAVGSALYTVLTSVMRGFSRGGMAIVARFVGANDSEGADRAAAQTAWLLILTLIPTAAIGLVAGPWLLGLMGARGELLQEATSYLQVSMWGLFFLEMVPCMDNVIRAAGYPRYTMIANIAYVAAMAVAEPLLVMGFGPIGPLGVRGAGLAAVFGSMIGSGVLGWVLWRGKAGLRIKLSDLRPDPRILARILRIGSPVAAQRLSPSLSRALQMAIVSSLGADVLTAFSVVSQLSWFLQCPTTGIGLAAATMTGQNLGARRPDRAMRSVVVSATSALALSFLLFGLLALRPRWTIGLFSPTASVLAIAIVAAQYSFWGQLAAALANIVGASLEGAGDTLPPMIAHTASLWLVQLPLSWVLSQWLLMGHEGVWLGLIAGNASAAIVLSWRFLRRRWLRAEA
jgi:putative MATE family efflux protein